MPAFIVRDIDQAASYGRAAVQTMFQVGDEVENVRGYRWPGKVVAVFTTLAGERRVVVECTVPEVAGALHIYSPHRKGPHACRPR
jgi:hypothetical protein